MSVTRTTLLEHLRANPTNVRSATTTSHMITTSGFLQWGRASGTVFDAIFLLVPLKCFEPTRTEILVVGAAHEAVLFVARYADNIEAFCAGV
jgi:hypothetical protein